MNMIWEICCSWNVIWDSENLDETPYVEFKLLSILPLTVCCPNFLIYLFQNLACHLILEPECDFV